jgi:hypothetical protein
MAKRPARRIKLTISEKDQRKTLQDLDGEDWGEPNFPSHLVTECHRLHRTPLCDFRTEDLRIMIGQQLCLPYLVPLAIEQLQADPLTAGAFYPGDLLQSVLRIGPAFWKDYPAWRQQVEAILQHVSQLPSELVDSATAFTQRVGRLDAKTHSSHT